MKLIATFLFASVLLAAAAPLAVGQTLTPIASFDGSTGEYPEGMTVDDHGNCYLSLVFGGRIKKVAADGAQSVYAQIPDNWLLGMTFDQAGNLVVCGASGIWKVAPNGSVSMFATVPGHNFLNDVAYDHHGNLFVTDSNAYCIWKIDPQGNAVLWSADPLLQGASSIFPFPLGPNGIRFDDSAHTLYVLNTSAGRVVRFNVNRDGTASAGSVVVSSSTLFGADGMDIDPQGDLYIAVNIQDRIVRVTPHGDLSDVVVGGALATPTALAFRRGAGWRKLYVCNNGNVFFSSTPFGEGLLLLDLGHGE